MRPSGETDSSGDETARPSKSAELEDLKDHFDMTLGMGTGTWYPQLDFSDERLLGCACQTGLRALATDIGFLLVGTFGGM